MTKGIKLYLHTKHNDLDEQIDTYSDVFGVEPYKRISYTEEIVERNGLPKEMVGKTFYSNIKINDDMMFMISRHTDRYNVHPYGTNSSTILFFDEDKDEFNRIYERMSNHQDFKLQYDKNTWNSWNTQIVKFNDKFGYSWILELDIRKVDNDWNPVRGKLNGHKPVDEKKFDNLYKEQKEKNGWK